MDFIVLVKKQARVVGTAVKKKLKQCNTFNRSENSASDFSIFIAINSGQLIILPRIKSVNPAE